MVYYHATANDNRDVNEPIFRAFAERINRPVFVVANHDNSAVTPYSHHEYLMNLFAGLDATARNDLSAGVAPYTLHFYSWPLLNRLQRRHRTNWYTLTGPRGHAVLDYAFDPSFDSLDGQSCDNRISDFNTELRNEGLLDQHPWLHLGQFVHTIPDNYIHGSTLGALTEQERPEDAAVPPYGAIVCENAAFIPRDVIHSPAATPILEHLLSLIKPDTDLSGEEIAAREEAFRKALEARQEAAITSAVENVKSWIGNLSNASVRQAEERIESTLSDINRYQREIGIRYQRLQEYMLTVEVGRKMTRKVKSSEINTLAKIMRKGIITELTTRHDLVGPMLRFITRPLLMQDERTGAYHLLGKMQVNVNMQSGQVTALNLDRQVHAFSTNMQAPHIWSDGNPCLGNFSDAVAGFVHTGDWLAAIELTLAFLESANTEDPAGSKVHRWPYVADPTTYGYPAYPDAAPEPYDDTPPEEEGERPYDDPPEDEEER